MQARAMQKMTKTQHQARSEIVELWRRQRPQDRTPVRADMQKFYEQIAATLPIVLSFRTLRPHEAVVIEWLEWEEIAGVERLRQSAKNGQRMRERAGRP